MRLGNVKAALIATASASTLCLALGINPASATPPPFNINPNVLAPGGQIIPSPGAPYAPVTSLTDIQGSSDALVQQTGASTQTETGWVQMTSFANAGGPVSAFSTGLVFHGTGAPPSPSSTFYGLFLQFTAVVHGVSGFNPAALGTIGAYAGPGTGLFATLYGDPTDDEVFTAASQNTSGGTVPTVATDSSDDVLGFFYSVNGDAGTDAATGAPRLDVTANFVICDGTTNSGFLNGKLVDATHLVSGANLAAGCGTFDARTYFTFPSPFYGFAFDSSQAGSAQNVSGAGGAEPNLALNGIVTDLNFIRIPEPATLALFGFGLMGLGWFNRKRQKSAT